MKKIAHKPNSKGFTLIELLIVIVILGILAGVVVSTIKPDVQQRKANETVLRSDTEKACLAMFACAATTEFVAKCNTWDELAVDDAQFATAGQPVLSISGTTTTVTGTLNTCVINCSYNFSSGAIVNMTTGAGCLID